MNDSRVIEDHLREEYSRLLSQIRRVTEYLEAEIKYHLLPIMLQTDEYDRIAVTSRVKDCESALDALRRRQEAGTFDRGRSVAYTLTALPDLAGVRALAFPSERWAEIEKRLCKRFPSWEADPIPGLTEGERPLAPKYDGYCEASSEVRAEIQIVPMLIGMFREVEHAAIYKPGLRLKGVSKSQEMKRRTLDVYRALENFEREFVSDT
jgi:hypothetical protein